MKNLRLRISVAWAAIAVASAFTPPSRQHQHSTALNEVVRALEPDFVPLDPGLGGVALANDSAIKVTGTVKHKPGSAEAQTSDLLRYTKLRDVSQETVDNMNGVRVVCTGMGSELYKDPGETTVNVITLAPLDAVRDATMNAAGSTQGADKVVINFMGGDDLQMLEVLDAIQHMVVNLDVETRAKISFNSLCHNSFPAQDASLTVVALAAGEEGPLVGSMTGAEKSVAQGEVYWANGKYVTVVEEDINDAIA